MVANVCLSYGMQQYGYSTEAMTVAQNVVAMLAADLMTTNTWHESYDSTTGAGLAAPGFLSWNTLAATWMTNLRSGIDPFEI